MIGALIGQRYRIHRRVGAGGMGAVYEATDAQTNARVAVKVITAESERNATLMGRFEREARATMTLATPHIVQVLDAGKDGPTGLPFLVMEFLEGEDVSHLIKRLGPLPPDLALRITAQALIGLGQAHAARIIHRDIKPANFYLAKGAGTARTVKLLDFGIAKITHDPADSKAETAGLTRTGSMLGSPLYMSPEQARGLKEIDRRADLWSMGVVLYQALTGRTPHQDSDALGELIIAICTEVPAPIQELSPWVPAEIAAIAHGAMRFDPDERYQSAEQMLALIQPLLPNGWDIDESMFRPLAEAERGRVEAKYNTLPDTPVPRGGRTTGGGRGAITPADAAAPSIGGLGTTVGVAGRSGRGLVIGGAVAALVAGGVLAWKLFGGGAPAGGVAPQGAGSAFGASSVAAATKVSGAGEPAVTPDGGPAPTVEPAVSASKPAPSASAAPAVSARPLGPRPSPSPPPGLDLRNRR